MNYNNIFAFIRNQKAFTAFMTTLVVLGSFSAVFAARGAQAETVFLNVKYTLADPKQNTKTMHTIEFKNINALTPASPITITYSGSVVFSAVESLGKTDVKATVGGTNWTIRDTACGAGATEFYFEKTASSTSFTPCQNIPATSDVKFILGDNTATNKITNPIVTGNSQAVDVKIAHTATTQSQKVKVMVLKDHVQMTASVDPIFTFQVASTSIGTNVNGATTNVLSDDYKIDFGVLPTDGTSKIAAQKLVVSTNAINGFNVTAQTNDLFRSENGAVIDAFNVQNVGATASSAPQVWTSLAAADPTNDKTWGQIGMTTTDTTNTIAGLGANQWVGNFIMNPVIVLSNSSSSKQASTTVGYQVQISDLQEAATDYKTNVIYVATPQF